MAVAAADGRRHLAGQIAVGTDLAGTAFWQSARPRYDPLSLGALVTTHKINLLDAARDRPISSTLRPHLREISRISSGRRAAWLAKDPIPPA